MERRSKSRNRKTKCTFGGQSSGSENRSPAEAKKFKAIKKIFLKVKAPKSETESETKYMDSKDLPPPIRNKPVSGTFGGQRSGSENRSPAEAKKFKAIKKIYLKVKAPKSETESETKYMDSKDLPPPIRNKPVSGTFGGQRSGSENRSPAEAKKLKAIKKIYLKVKAPKSETESETKYMDSKDLPPPIRNKPVSGTFGGQRSGSENRSPDEAKKFKAFYSKVKAPMSETESETKYMDSKDLPPPIRNKPVSGTFGGQRSGSENRSPAEAKKFKAFYSKVKAPMSETESETKYMDSKDLPPPIRNKPVSGTFGGQRSGSENRSPDEAKKFKAFYSKVKAPKSETESETKYMDSKDLPPPISNKPVSGTFGGQRSGSENRSPDEAKIIKAFYLKVKAPKSETESETKYMDSKDLPPPISNKPVSGTFGGQRSGSENRSPDEAKIIKAFYLKVKAPKSETESETKYMDSKDLPPPISNKPVSGTFGGQRSGSENRSPDEAKKFKAFYSKVKAPMSETESETKYMDSKDLPPPIRNKPVSGTFGGQRSGSENRSPDEAKKFKAFYSKVKAPKSETESETKYMDSKDLPPPISNKPVSGTFGGQRSGSENRSPDEAKIIKAFYLKVKAPKSETESETKYMDSKDLPPPISNKPVSGTFGGQRSGSENRSPDEAKIIKAFYLKVKAPKSETESETKYMDSKDLPPPISNKPVSGTFGGQRSGSENRSPDEAKKFKAFYSKVKAPMSETESETKYMDSKDLPPPISNKPVSGTLGGQRSGSENRSPDEAKKFKIIKNIYLEVKAPKSETESETKYMDSKDLPPPISNKPVSGTFGSQRSGSENRSPDEAKKFKVIKTIYSKVKAPKSETESETEYMDSKDLPPPISKKPVSGTFGGQRSGSENRSPDEAQKFKAIKKIYLKLKAPKTETESETEYMDSKDLPPPIRNKPVSAFKLKRVSGTFGGQRSGSENRSRDEAKKFKAIKTVYLKVKAPKSETESETEYMDSKDLPPPVTPPSSPDPDRPRVCTFLRKGPLVDKPLYGEKNPRIISKNGRMLKTPEFDIPLPCKPAIPVNETPRKFTKKKSKQSSSKPTAAKKK